MIKKCRICGAEFETPNSNYCTCSPTCSIKNRNIMAQKYYYAHPENRRKDRERQRKKSNDSRIERAWNTYGYTMKDLKESLKDE